MTLNIWDDVDLNNNIYLIGISSNIPKLAGKLILSIF